MTNKEAIRLMRNLPTMCEFTDAYGEPIDSDAYYEAIDMAISALQAQELSKNSPKLDKENGDLQPTCNQLEKDINVPCKDSISRQAAIDVCDNAIDLWHGQLGEGIVIAVKKKIEELLPAQPEIEERTEEFAQNVPKEDLISRKVAIDALMDFDKKLRKINWYRYPHTEYECRGVDEAIVKIENVPSAQPDGWLEQNKDKILQAGMEGREIGFRIGGRLFAIREKAQ